HPALHSFPTRRSSDLSRTPTLAWAAHVASDVNWGSGQAAANISGSPYHVSVSFNGSQQDHQMQSSVVTIPGDAITKTGSIAGHTDRKSTRLNSSHVAI